MVARTTNHKVDSKERSLAHATDGLVEDCRQTDTGGSSTEKREQRVTRPHYILCAVFPAALDRLTLTEATHCCKSGTDVNSLCSTLW